MARYTLRELEIARISEKMPSNYRYRLQDPVLEASIRKFGILMPLVVTGGKDCQIIAGHKRLHAARACGFRELPVLEAGLLQAHDMFLFNLLSNWRQECSEMDRARAITLAVSELDFQERDILQTVMPLLGLPSDRNLAQAYCGAAGLVPGLQDFLEDGILSFRGIAFLTNFSKKDQESFARLLGKGVKWTSSQLLQVGEWLTDIMKRTGSDLEKFFQEKALFEIWQHPGMDPRTKADKLLNQIKKIRFPEYSSFLEKFDRQCSEVLQGDRDISFRPVEGFEEKGFELRARVRTPGDLDSLIKKISQERPALNSLFDVVL